MQRWIVLTVLTSALTGLAVPAVADAPAPTGDPAPAATVAAIGEVRIDPRIPGRVRVDVDYLCSVADETRSLTVSVEQRDPEDSSSIAFGSSRTAEADVICDGTRQHRQVVVQSKTVNWIPGADAVVIATVSDIGATPSAFADSRRVKLAAG
ncbi:hypothetical protein ABT247_29440 [Kitasatospora sp. NPDC001539]|uniref:hypothetical protein n=1 Tax=Kitasatospora sp. NPDC001539 TaxID=3154384 RepID=UPI003317AEF3